MLIQNTCSSTSASNLTITSHRCSQNWKCWESKFHFMKNKGTFETRMTIQEVSWSFHVIQTRWRGTQTWIDHGKIPGHKISSNFLHLFFFQIPWLLEKASECLITWIIFIKQKICKNNYPSGLTYMDSFTV